MIGAGSCRLVGAASRGLRNSTSANPNVNITGALNSSSAPVGHDWPRASSWSRRTVASTLAACSPPVTEMRAFGHIHRKLGEYARPHIA